MDFPLYGLAIAVFIALIWFWNSLYVIKEWERGVVLRLGRMQPDAKGAGLRLVFWPVETLYRISLRIETLDVPSQDIITRDNVSVKVNAVAYFRVVDANLALSQVQNYLYATSQKAQTTLRSIVGQFELDEILAEREKVNSKLQVILDQDTEPWGIKVTKVEVKQVDIPEQMQRAIGRQAEAERERRAKVIHAEGEAQASAKLAEAAKVLGIAEVLVLDHPDGELRWEHVHELHVQIVSTIKACRPDSVITFAEDGLYWHLDHIGVHERTYTAVKSLGAEAPPLYYVTMAKGVVREVVETAIAARDVPVGQSWAFREHRTMAQVIAQEKSPTA